METNNELIAEKITNETYSLSAKRKGKSHIWTILAQILKEDGTLLEGYVYCRSCRKVLKNSGNQTSNLNRHKCCQAVKQPQILKNVAPFDRQIAIDTCAEWIIEDCCPFSSVSGSGFIKLARFLIKIGAQYGGNVDVGDLLPDATTLAQKIQKAADEKRDTFSDEIKGIVKSGGASVTIDIWSDRCVNRNFLGATLHYQKNFEMFNVILGLKSMDFKNSTGENILTKLKTLFSQFGVEELDSIKFITDQDANIVNALENKIHLSCSSHLLANVLDKSFEETSELVEILQACKSIVKYIKKAHTNHQIQSSVKNPCLTCWNSNYTMLKSITDNWNEINNILKETGETKRLLHINISTLAVLVELCKQFEFIFKKLQACTSPSLCFVLPSIRKIKNICIPRDNEIQAISALKGRIVKNIDLIWLPNISIWHQAALFLFPPAVNEQPDDLSIIKKFCIAQTINLDNCTPSSLLEPTLLVTNDQQTEISSDGTSSQFSCDDLATSNILSSPSTNKNNKFFFPDLLEASENTSRGSVNDEIEKYSRKTVNISKDFDLIQWWKNNEKCYPQLCKLALQIHSIPASCAALQRVFPLAGNILTEKRSRLAPKSLDSLLFLNSLKNL